MKHHVLKALVKLKVDRFSWTPKRVSSKLSGIRDTMSTWSVMPEEDLRSLNQIEKYWTKKRIDDALETFRGDYKDTSLPFYYRVLMSAELISEYRKIIDFGAGTGSNSHMLSKIFPATKFFCYDLAYNVPRVFDAFSKVMTTENVSYHSSLDNLISPGQLIFSNLVFSHLSRYQLSVYLDIFKRNQSDILMMANTLAAQDEKAPHTRLRPNNFGLFDHNYQKFLTDAGYVIRWLYKMEDLAKKDKKMVIIYATAPVTEK